MHHAEPHELGLFQPRHQPQHARLVAPLDLRLEAHEAEVIAGESVLAQLDDGVGRVAGARIAQPDRLHRAEPQRVAAAVRHHLDRQAALEEHFPVEVVDRRRLGVDERVVEAVVLVAAERAIQIVALAVVHAAGRPCLHGLRRGVGRGGVGCARRGEAGRLGLVALPEAPVPARGAEDLRSIDALGEDDRADGVVEVEVIAADEAGQIRGEAVRRERSGGDDGRHAGRGDGRDLAAMHRDARMRGDRVGHHRGEAIAIDGQRRARGHARGVRRAHHERAEPPHLLLEEADGVVEFVAAEGVAADQLGEPVALVNGRRPNRPHLVELDVARRAPRPATLLRTRRDRRR